MSLPAKKGRNPPNRTPNKMPIGKYIMRFIYDAILAVLFILCIIYGVDKDVLLLIIGAFLSRLPEVAKNIRR